ncbi:hypothetical protein SSX86_016377 [Deinandra increscens subsp. villosa]|uniref:DBC1/CARP1 catalytically inactive NUDIX hydrolase domain-containing protein n=1 Tax=Deinandra increscens subsp. villosa TaxID=3103831 RepID=A0AAP0GY10_9ASTR
MTYESKFLGEEIATSRLTNPDFFSKKLRSPAAGLSPFDLSPIIYDSKINFDPPLSSRQPIQNSRRLIKGETLSEHEPASIKTVTNGQATLESGTTRWNAKMLLMSGLSRNAWEELLSERKYDDHIPHLCNMLRFAFLKKGNSLMAIGGSWDTVDGNDPSVNKSTLIQTVSRCAKELTGLDIKNCRNWNPFREVWEKGFRVLFLL